MLKVRFKHLRLIIMAILVIDIIVNIMITTVSIILASDEGVILVCQQWPVSSGLSVGRSVKLMTPSPEASPIAPDVASRGDSPARCADVTARGRSTSHTKCKRGGRE